MSEIPPQRPFVESTPIGQLGQSFVDRYAVNPILFAFGCLASIFVLYQFGGALLALVFIGSTAVTRENVGLFRLLTVGGQLGLILLPTLVFARLLSRDLSRVFQFRIPSLKESLFALIGLLSLQRLFDAYAFFQEKIPIPEALKKLMEPLKQMFEELLKTLVKAESVPELVFVILVVALVPAIVEEMMFRGVVQTAFERAMSPLAATVLTGTIFALFHLNPFDLVPLVVLGCFLGFLRQRSRSILLPMAVHGLNNLMAVLAVYLHLEDTSVVAENRLGLTASFSVVLQIVLFGAVFAFTIISYYRASQVSPNVSPGSLNDS